MTVSEPEVEPHPTIPQTHGSTPQTAPIGDQSTDTHHQPATDPKPQPAHPQWTSARQPPR